MVEAVVPYELQVVPQSVEGRLLLVHDVPGLGAQEHRVEEGEYAPDEDVDQHREEKDEGGAPQKRRIPKSW